MADTTFVSQVTNIVVAWVQAINNLIYRGQNPLYAASTGSANAYVLTLPAGSLVTTANIADGDSFTFKANFTNSGAATLKLTVSAGSDVATLALQLDTAALSGGEIVSGSIYTVYKLASSWQIRPGAFATLARSLLSQTTTAGQRTVTGTKNTTDTGEIANLTHTTDQFIQSNGSAWVLGSMLRRNILINGDYDVWQAGTSFTGVTVSQKHTDMNTLAVNLQGTWTVARDTDVPTVAQAGRQLNYSLKLTCTTADATVNAGDYALNTVAIEGYDYEPLYQQTQTFQFWVKSNTTGTYCISFRNSGSDRSYIATYTVSVANTWERKTITITAIPSAGTWNFTNGLGLSVTFALAAGATYQTTALAWQNGNFLGTSAQINLAATLNNFIAIADARFVLGSDAGSVVVPTFQEKLSNCRRFYQKSFIYTTAPAQNVGVATGEYIFPAGKAGALAENSPSVRLVPSMGTAPTVTLYNPAATNAQVRDEDAVADCTASAVARIGTEQFLIGATGAAGTAVGNALGVHWSADARL